MADNLRLVTWNGETVTPQDDAILYQSGTVDGVYDNLEFSIKDATTIHMSGSFAIMGGRFIELEAQDISVPLATTSAGLRGQIYLKLDLSNADNPLELLSETANTLQELTPMTKDEDLNVDNGIYMMQLTVFGVSSSTVFNIQDETDSELPVTCSKLPKSLNNFNSNLATVEETYFASQNYGVGSYLVYNQQLYKVTATIRQGDTLEVGTNIARAVLGTDVSNLFNSPISIKKGSNNLSQIYMQANANKEVLRAYGGDNNGIGVMIGAGGTTVIGGGEFAANAINADVRSAKSGSAETLLLGSDTSTYIYSNANTIGEAKEWAFYGTGNTHMPGDIKFFKDSSGANRKYADKWLMSEILSDIVKTQTFSTNVTANGNATQTVTVTITIPTGYKLVDIVRVGSKNVVGICRVDSISGNKVTVKAYFLVAGTATVQATALFVRDI